MSPPTFGCGSATHVAGGGEFSARAARNRFSAAATRTRINGNFRKKIPVLGIRFASRCAEVSDTEILAAAQSPFGYDNSYARAGGYLKKLKKTFAVPVFLSPLVRCSVAITRCCGKFPARATNFFHQSRGSRVTYFSKLSPLGEKCLPGPLALGTRSAISEFVVSFYLQPVAKVCRRWFPGSSFAENCAISFLFFVFKIHRTPVRKFVKILRTKNLKKKFYVESVGEPVSRMRSARIRFANLAAPNTAWTTTTRRAMLTARRNCTFGFGRGRTDTDTDTDADADADADNLTLTTCTSSSCTV